MRLELLEQAVSELIRVRPKGNVEVIERASRVESREQMVGVRRPVAAREGPRQTKGVGRGARMCTELDIQSGQRAVPLPLLRVMTFRGILEGGNKVSEWAADADRRQLIR